MSAKTGDKSRVNRLRKRKFENRLVTRALRAELMPKTAKPVVDVAAT
jgi:hypothetical protein